MNKILRQIVDTPWKAVLEFISLPTTVLTHIYARIMGINMGNYCKFYGMPVFLRAKNSRISIGHRFENRNIYWSNPLGVNRPTLLCTWQPGAEIIIGDDVGISGGAICATQTISIGSGTLIGANCTIIDSDFHPIISPNRRYQSSGKSSPVVIGKNVFIGTGCIILKGTQIGDNSVIAAGSVVAKKIPPNRLYINNQIKNLS